MEAFFFSAELGLRERIAKSGALELPMALVFMWGYYLTMQSCSLKWELATTKQYIEECGYNVVLGDMCAGEKSMQKHGWVRIGLKLSVNSFQTSLRTNQLKCWGVVFKGSLKIKEEKVQNDSRYEIVDIGEYLPAKVK